MSQRFMTYTFVVCGLLLPSGYRTGWCQTQQATPVLDGAWTYRSLRNNPAEGLDWNQHLRFAEGPMQLTIQNGKVSGSLFAGTEFEMKLKGRITFGNPVTLRFQGRGSGSQSQNWVYDYHGYLAPDWPAGIDQKSAIVGTVIRTEPHGNAPAGYVASFVMVRNDNGSVNAGTDLAANTHLRHPKVVTGVPESIAILGQPGHVRSDLNLAELMTADVTSDSDALTIARRMAPRSASDISSSRLSAELETLLPRSQQLSLALSSSNELKNPDAAVVSPDGYIHLNVDYAEATIGDDKVRLRTYNGALVGPTIRITAGDTLKVLMSNKLPGGGGGGHDPNNPNGHHDWNVTNLHTHGLHVAPQKLPGDTDASDNVLIRIKPQESQKYSIRVPQAHEAGTFWYHAHVHGSTSAQVSSGMAGMLIVEQNEPSLDQVPEIAAAEEKIMVMQQVPYIKRDENGDVVSSGGVGQIELEDLPLGIFGPTYWHNSGRYTTINGQEVPRITLQPGEVQRWRMVHSGVREELRLMLIKAPNGGNGPSNLQFHEIAVDGLPLGDVRTSDQVTLYPGYRSDVLVKAPDDSGHYVLVDDTSPGLTGGDDEPLKYIAHVVVEGERVNMQLPTVAAVKPFRRKSLTPQDVTRRGRQLLYGIRTENGLEFAIKVDNGVWRPFSSDPANDLILKLGDIEEFVIGTQNSGQIGAGHPFHIHVNPFEVVEEWIENPDGSRTTLPVERDWRDTLIMEHGHRYRIRTRIETFVGTFVHHCHILDHEDQGMMQRVTIE